jgi:hypothetical protein
MHELVFVILVVLSFLVGFIFNEVIRSKKDDGKMEFSERLKND